MNIQHLEQWQKICTNCSVENTIVGDDIPRRGEITCSHCGEPLLSAGQITEPSLTAATLARIRVIRQLNYR